MKLEKTIRSIPDYPKKGILFRDITSLLENKKAFRFSSSPGGVMISARAQEKPQMLY